ncbi:uncharacterized protein LOC143201026 [Rhynchophorus ferrugineus]|uniref:uncharacterized protein LOC143201026 n=1 Tax=Rhynchophorus ferrugineus TaxID=354439 RepID=UPI003FCD73DD
MACKFRMPTAKCLGMTLDAKIRWKKYIRKNRDELNISPEKCFGYLAEKRCFWERRNHSSVLLIKHYLQPDCPEIIGKYKPWCRRHVIKNYEWKLMARVQSNPGGTLKPTCLATLISRHLNRSNLVWEQFGWEKAEVATTAVQRSSNFYCLLGIGLFNKGQSILVDLDSHIGLTAYSVTDDKSLTSVTGLLGSNIFYFRVGEGSVRQGGESSASGTCQRHFFRKNYNKKILHVYIVEIFIWNYLEVGSLARIVMNWHIVAEQDDDDKITFVSRARHSTNNRASLNPAAFSYDVSIDYSNYQCVVIGSMNLVCSHCKALKYKNEANGLCCANGKVKLIQLDPPPEPLYSLVSGIGTDSIHFLTHIQQYNNCFQMTSFGATNAVRENFMPTFKIQGQIYHRAGSLLPVSDSDNKFLQIYFMGNSPQEIDLRCAHNNLVKRSIVEQLQTLFHQHNQLIILFKTALDLMPSDNHKIVIRADKTPAGQHTRRFNAPTIDEVAIVVVGENLESRDIVLHRRNFQLQPIKETHRSYDALQYPIIFWQGEDGYDLSIKMINPITGSETNKKVSSMNYYSYRLMIRENADNRILKCRRLYHKYVDDMNKKAQSETALAKLIISQ